MLFDCHECREQLMKWNDEAGRAHLLSSGIQQNLQLAITAVSRHIVMAVLLRCLPGATNYKPSHKRQRKNINIYLLTHILLPLSTVYIQIIILLLIQGTCATLKKKSLFGLFDTLTLKLLTLFTLKKEKK